MAFSLLLGRVYFARRLSPGYRSHSRQIEANQSGDHRVFAVANVGRRGVAKSRSSAKANRVGKKLFDREVITSVDALLSSVGLDDEETQGVFPESELGAGNLYHNCLRVLSGDVQRPGLATTGQ
jgi:hypothetical protein